MPHLTRRAFACAALLLGSLLTGGNAVSAQVQPGTISGTVKTVVRLPAGLRIPVRMVRAMDSKTLHAGQQWEGTLEEPIKARNGRILIPSGSAVSGLVTAAKSAASAHGAGTFSLQVVSIANSEVSTTLLIRTGKPKTTLLDPTGAGAPAQTGHVSASPTETEEEAKIPVGAVVSFTTM